MRLISSRFFTTPLLLLLFIGVWHFWILAFNVSPYIVPTPLQVGEGAVAILGEARTYDQLLFTIQGSVYGFLAAAIVGVGLGIILGKLPPLESALSPFIVASQVAPKVAFIPLFLLWFGFGLESKVFVAMLLSFFPIFSNTILGMKSVDPGARDVMKANGASMLQSLRYLEVPSSMPYIMSGLEIGMVFAVVGEIVAEYLGGSSGLGFMAISTLNALQLDRLFALILLMTLMGYALYAVVGALKSLTIPWHESMRRDRSITSL